MIGLIPETTLATVADQVPRLLQPPLLYLPIRHHSPACAEHVRKVILEHRPSAVVVEGPPSFDDQIDLLLDPLAAMPLAIYSHATFAAESAVEGEEGQPSSERSGSYFPLCDYSPELVALRAGREVGARLRFADLDYVDMASRNETLAGHTDETMLFSQTLRRAAAELGCRDHNELWDQMVEGTDHDTVDHFTAVLTYGVMARLGAAEEELVLSRNGAREVAMARRVAEEAARGDGPVVVVTGAFHTVAVRHLVERLLDGEELPTSEFPASLESGHGLIRYSFDRLDALAGYAAGMASPRWYQLEWQRRMAAEDETASPVGPANQVIGEVATALRELARDGQPSLPSVVDANAAARQLHRLRGRTVPTRFDVVDAMVSCFVKGEDTPRGPVRVEAHRSMSGFALGKVPPSTPRVPLARDFDRLTTKLGLVVETSEPKQVNLDVYRSERDRLRSRFLHGLVALDVRYGRCISPLRFSRTAGRELIRERWVVQMDGATDVTLTEASLWGASIEEAITARTRRSLDDLLETQPSSLELMGFIRRAAERGVHSMVSRTVTELRSRIGVDPSLDAVVDALSEAELLWLGREPLGGSELLALPDLANQLYVRACQLGSRLCEAPEDTWRKHLEALAALHRSLLTGTWNVDQELFWEMLAAQRDLVSPGMLRGAIVGLEWRGGVAGDDVLLDALAAHTGVGSSTAASIGFVEGLILVARDALWEVDGVIAQLSAMIEGADSAAFLQQVPGFRSAFSALAPAETDRVAEMVTGLLGDVVATRVVGVSEAEALRFAALSVEAEERLREDGLGEWLSGDGGLGVS